MNLRRLKKAKVALKVRQLLTQKERQAQSLACRAKADYESSLNDINQTYGTNYTYENFQWQR